MSVVECRSLEGRGQRAEIRAVGGQEVRMMQQPEGAALFLPLDDGPALVLPTFRKLKSPGGVVTAAVVEVAALAPTGFFLC